MGAFFSNDRMDFRAVLSAFTAADISMPASGRWAGAGMVRGHTPDLAWRLMDAQHWASPRLARRQRVFVVADFGGQCSHEILFKPRAVQSISASGGDCWLSAACGDRGSFIEAGRRVPITRPFQCYRMRASAKERTTEAFRNSFGLPTDPFPTLLASAVSPFAFWYEDDPAGAVSAFPRKENVNGSWGCRRAGQSAARMVRKSCPPTVTGRWEMLSRCPAPSTLCAAYTMF